MSSKYEKTVELSREEEGTYHRREYERSPSREQSKPTYTTQSYQVVSPRPSDDRALAKDAYLSSDDDRYEEWTTSKRKVNHKTRQVETRVARQLVLEDGKVIADSGPQVVTRIKEDNKVEECEKEKAPKNKAKFDAITNAPECDAGDSPLGGRVLGEKKEIQRVSREVREENMQYHDERFKELTGKDVHSRAIRAPHELITITDKESQAPPRGKMVHYSNKGKKYQDTDEIFEVAKLAIDGSITKEVKRTKHHEEFSEDEKPDEKGEAEALRREPIASKSSRRHVDYVNDFDDTSTPSYSSDDDEAKTTSKHHRHQQHRPPSPHHHHHAGGHRKHYAHKDDAAFPRYQIDPLLDSLKDEDFKPALNESRHRSPGRYKELRLERRERPQSSDSEAGATLQRGLHHQQRQSSPSPAAAHQRGGAVEIPEEYRVNRQRLLSSKQGAAAKPAGSHQRERSFSPVNRSHLSHASHKSSKSHRSHKEDASVQARLTDEEEERKSIRSSSSSAHSHERTTKHLQRQSTANSSRNYYFGQSRRRSKSVESSSSASSLSDPKEKLRKNGARSKDSGFKSPHSMGRTATPISTGSQQQIYSVSSKSKKGRPYGGQESASKQHHRDVVSPTPTAGSVGQRSVKTTTTTYSAGLADRPLSRSSGERASSKEIQAATQSKRGTSSSANNKRTEGGKPPNDHSTFTRRPTRAVTRVVTTGTRESAQQQPNPKHYDRNNYIGTAQQLQEEQEDAQQHGQHNRHSPDNVSLSSLGPGATTIKVPYQQAIVADHSEAPISPVQPKVDEMTLQGNIESLRKRLANIKQHGSTNNSGSRDPTAIEERSQQSPEHFDYKTIIANVQSAPIVPRQQIVDAYNVRVIEHNSPLHEQLQPIRSVNELSNSIARLELLSSEYGGGAATSMAGNHSAAMDNNNEANFNLNYYTKHKAVPVIVDSSSGIDDLKLNDDEDQLSISSSCSLRSSRTYDIRNSGAQAQDEADLNEERDFPVAVQELATATDDAGSGADDGKTKPAAWVFDLRDGSTTKIVAPPRPKPDTPKVDAKTEELAQSRGGRSYYLELIEQDKRAARRQRPSSIDSLYSRWNSHSTLTSANDGGGQPRHTTPIKTPAEASTPRKSRQLVPPSGSNYNKPPTPPPSSSNANNKNANNKPNNCQQQRRQLPFSGPPLGNRSKSVSCLMGATRSTKYSIYGGLRRPDAENKPVPRLSYSRAIGPKSQRQIDAQSKTPSRYLKMR